MLKVKGLGKIQWDPGIPQSEVRELGEGTIELFPDDAQRLIVDKDQYVPFIYMVDRTEMEALGRLMRQDFEAAPQTRKEVLIQRMFGLRASLVLPAIEMGGVVWDYELNLLYKYEEGFLIPCDPNPLACYFTPKALQWIREIHKTYSITYFSWEATLYEDRPGQYLFLSFGKKEKVKNPFFYIRALRRTMEKKWAELSK